MGGSPCNFLGAPLLDEGGTFTLLGRLPLSHDGKWTTEVSMCKVTGAFEVTCLDLSFHRCGEEGSSLQGTNLWCKCHISVEMCKGHFDACVTDVFLLSSSRFQPMILYVNSSISWMRTVCSICWHWILLCVVWVSVPTIYRDLMTSRSGWGHREIWFTTTWMVGAGAFPVAQW